MPNKKQYTEKEKMELMLQFSEHINSGKSCRIVQYFLDSKKDMNKLLETAYKYRALC